MTGVRKVYITIYRKIWTVFLLLSLLAGLGVGQAWAGNGETTYSGYMWRVDAQNKEGLPRNFRTCQSDYAYRVTKKLAHQLDAEKMPSREGLENIRISGSAQPSDKQFKAMAAALRTHTTGPIYDVDLRQETHGYFNGLAVSWYGLHDWGNIGQPNDVIVPNEKRMLAQEAQRFVRIGDLDEQKNSKNLTYIKVKQVQTEAQVATANGLRYCRIPCTDHVWPAAASIDEFIRFYKKLPKDAWLHFHCEAGQGRTTVFMAMTDMMRNPQVPMEDILYRQYLLGGNYVAYKVEQAAPEDWKAPYYADKAKMIRLFSQYVKQNYSDDYRLSWSQWLKRNNLNGNVQ